MSLHRFNGLAAMVAASIWLAAGCTRPAPPSQTAPAAATKPGRALDIATPEGAIAAFRKIQCSTEDRRPTVYYWTGETYSRVPGEPDRLLFRFEGMNTRQCKLRGLTCRSTGPATARAPRLRGRYL